jgi:site-specific recombinase XerD
MVNAGVSLKEVADLLGHQSLTTTSLYAKLNLETLAGVALPWQGGTA